MGTCHDSSAGVLGFESVRLQTPKLNRVWTWTLAPGLRSSALSSLPIGSSVVPFWDYLIDPRYQPQKGTTKDPVG